MAAGDAILPEHATIYIVANGTTPSALDSSDAVEAEVTNFSQSGGEEDVESRKVFGGGNIDLTKPREQIEVSFDIILRYGSSTVTKWDSYIWGSTLKSSGDSPKTDIYIQFSDGGTEYYSRAYRAAKGITFEPDVAADDLFSGTITFKLSPTDADGKENHQVSSSAVSTLTWT
jgi:hypothetical protein